MITVVNATLDLPAPTDTTKRFRLKNVIMSTPAAVTITIGDGTNVYFTLAASQFGHFKELNLPAGKALRIVAGAAAYFCAEDILCD